MKTAIESLKIILLCIVASVVYGILHDQVTARVCVEYFTIGHPPIFHTEGPTLLAFGWGVIATWWMGLILSVPAVLASRLGSWPKFDAAHSGASDLLPADRHGLFLTLGWRIGLLCCKGRWRAIGRFPGFPCSIGKARCVLGRSLGTPCGLWSRLLRRDYAEHLGCVSAAAIEQAMTWSFLLLVLQRLLERTFFLHRFSPSIPAQ